MHDGWKEGLIMNRKKQQLNIWSDFVGETSLHGVRFAIHKNRHMVVKVIWTCFVICTVSFLSFNLNRLYNTYKEYNFETKTNVKFVNQFEFPALTICNTHSFDKTKVLVNHTSYAYFQSSFAIHQIKQNYTEDKWKRTEVTMDLLKSMSFTANDTFIYAKYNEEKINVNNELKMVFPLNLCTCFTYNGQWFNTNLSPKISTIGSTLTMYININQDRYAFAASRAGIQMAVHPYEEPVGFGAGTVSLSPGNHYDMKLSVKNYNYLPTPHKSFQNRNCIERRDISAKVMKYFPRYTFKACELECLTDLIFDTCHCMVEFMVTTTHVRYCNVYERENCVYHIIIQAATAFHTICNCTHPCYETVYDVDSSSVVFPAKSFSDYLIKQNISESYDHARNNLIQITMSFKNAMLEEINHVPKLTIGQATSDLGGYMGFFLGASILTLIEIIEVVYRSISAGLTTVLRYKFKGKNIVHITKEQRTDEST